MDAVAESPCPVTAAADVDHRARAPQLRQRAPTESSAGSESRPARLGAGRRAANTARSRQYLARWTPEEDAVLLEHVMAHGTAEWGQLRASGRLPLRDNKACCNRFLLLKRKFLQHEQQFEQHQPQRQPPPETPSLRPPQHPLHPSARLRGLQPRHTAFHSSPCNLAGTTPAGVSLEASVGAFVKAIDSLHATAARQQQPHPRMLEQTPVWPMAAHGWQEDGAPWHGVMEPWLDNALIGPCVRYNAAGFEYPPSATTTSNAPPHLMPTAAPPSLAPSPPAPTTSNSIAAQPAAQTTPQSAGQHHVPSALSPPSPLTVLLDTLPPLPPLSPLPALPPLPLSPGLELPAIPASSPRPCNNAAAAPPSVPLPPAHPATPSTPATPVPPPLAGADAATSVGAGALEGQREADLDRWILEQVGLMAGGQGESEQAIWA
ncbi:unnamed protein product [Closterium sp. Naga37s-1]|nr:unnamed protein product [Closterium sp. Naga37s-1]